MAKDQVHAWPVMPTANGTDHTEGDACLTEDLDASDATDRAVGRELLKKILQSQTSELKADGTPKRWVETTQADFFFGGWICVNAFMLALETDLRTEENETNAIWVLIDSIFNSVFLAELVLRVYAERERWPYDVWNLFDAVLVFIGVMDTWILPITGLDSDMRFITLMRVFRLFRLIRVLRVLRLLRFFEGADALGAGHYKCHARHGLGPALARHHNFHLRTSHHASRWEGMLR